MHCILVNIWRGEENLTWWQSQLTISLHLHFQTLILCAQRRQLTGAICNKLNFYLLVLFGWTLESLFWRKLLLKKLYRFKRTLNFFSRCNGLRLTWPSVLEKKSYIRKVESWISRMMTPPAFKMEWNFSQSLSVYYCSSTSCWGPYSGEWRGQRWSEGACRSKCT